eukprot:13125193-Alexandrium_andersonii.AAC.1
MYGQTVLSRNNLECREAAHKVALSEHPRPIAQHLSGGGPARALKGLCGGGPASLRGVSAIGRRP